MASQELVKDLQYIGLNEREAKIYIALLGFSEATPSALHRLSGVTRTKVYEILERLVMAGFCIERNAGRVKYYRAIKPSVIRKTLEKEWKREQLKREKVMQELDSIALNNANDNNSLDAVIVMRNRAQINQIFIQAMSEVKKEVLSFVRPPYAAQLPGAAEDLLEANENALKRGIQFRDVFQADQVWHDFVIKAKNQGTSSQVRPRVLFELPVKMIIFDRRKTLIGLPSIPGKTNDDFTMMMIDDADFASMCVIVFETYWQRAMTEDEWQGGQIGS